MNEEDVKNKLLILFVLDTYELPINRNILGQMCCLDNNWISYFFYDQFISELIDGGFIIKRNDKRNENECLLEISEDGKICLNHFYGKIYESVRADVKGYIYENKLKYRKKQEFPCDYRRNSDGTFEVFCSVLDGEIAMFELKFTVPTEKKAASIAKKWQNAAPEMYKTYADLMID